MKGVESAFTPSRTMQVVGNKGDAGEGRAFTLLHLLQKWVLLEKNIKSMGKDDVLICNR